MTLEGVLGPNDRLEEARGIPIESPDALCVSADGRLFVSAGRAGRSPCANGASGRKAWAEFERPVTALASSPSGWWPLDSRAAGLRCATVQAARSEAGSRPPTSRPRPTCCSSRKTSWRSSTRLQRRGAVCCPSRPGTMSARGRLIAAQRDGRAAHARERPALPDGLCLDGRRSAGRHGIRARPDRRRLRSGPAKPAYPGYLGRLRRTGNGYVLACLSRRDPLIEFLKTEPDFVADMKATIAPRHWIAPRVSAGVQP